MIQCPKCGKEMEEMTDGKLTYGVCHECKFAALKTEIYSRCCGYLRPTSGWNKGKKEEFRIRKTYKIEA